MNDVQRSLRRGAVYGLLAAVTFGVTAPIAKRMLAEVTPLVLASLLYLGAGLALTVALLIRRRGVRPHETGLRRVDLPALAGITVMGGALGPVLMLLGLARVSGITGSLLLNLEGPMTAMLAIAVFREHLTARQALASVLIFGAAALVGWAPGPWRADAWGVVAISGACACWALDNNLTQRLTLRDPWVVVRFKTLAAGLGLLAIAFLRGDRLPAWEIGACALAVGSVGYGLSVLLDAYALRHLGAAQEAAFFATAPFVGAAAAIPILGERPSLVDLVAAGVMVAGVALLLRAKHSHRHVHDELIHDHLHVHDEHHRHQHERPVTEPHAHPHRHDRIEHEHEHASDLHHRHDHGSR